MNVIRRRAIVARALGGSALAVGASVTAFLAACLPDTPIDVIGRSSVQALLWPLAPVFLAACVPASLAWQARPQEQTSPRPHLELAARYVGLLAVACAVVVAVTPIDHRAVIVRNLLLLIGMGLASARWLRSGAAWVPVILLSIITWLFGTQLGGEPEPWAVLLAPRGDDLARTASATVLAAGVVSLLVGIRTAQGGDRW